MNTRLLGLIKPFQTLFLTISAIVEYQSSYFLTGDEQKLKPMILKDIADRIEMDISTISRVANSKYIDTPYGVKLLKSFFSEGMKKDDGEDVSTIEIKKYLKDINNAGSICIGNYSSMALSDYGPTQHTLPTSGSAKFSSGLGVREFIKQISYNELSKKGVAKLGKSGYLLSNFEDLIGHSKSIKIRMRRK